MNKAELAQKIADKVGITKSQAEQALEAFTGITIETIKAGGEIVLTGFGAFTARRRKGREGINPRNPSQKITVPSVVVAKFKAGKTLKDALKAIDRKEAPEVKSEKIGGTETQE
jgi:DNA-binding protein HU-beta